MSDVVRARALLVALPVAAAGALFTVLASQGASAALAPAPLSVPHARANVSCDGCHASATRSDACVGCHGQKRSSRAGHAQLQASGQLGCVDCHRSHGAQGVRVDERGALLRFAGENEAHATPESSLLAAGSALPLVPVERCASCHDFARSRDPAAHCATGTGWNVCFDEHARGASSLAGRAALDEAARAAALGSGRGPGPALWRTAIALGSALLLGLVGLFGVRWRGRLRPGKVGASAGPAFTVGPAAVRRRLPVIDANRCLGCAACVDACPHDVLEVARHVAIVARPDSCCGLALCAERCPNGSLLLLQGELLRDVPQVSGELESLDQPGLYLAGEITGQGLIRSAAAQGARAARAIAASLPRKASEEECVDLAIIGAGPAGLGAALEAKRLGLRAVVLEQGRIAESIQSFPRDKLVLPSGEQTEGSPLWIDECTKDELVRRWLREVRRAGLDVREHSRVSSLSRLDGRELGFEISCAGMHSESLRARRVLLAIGRRGSPRKLEAVVPDEALSRVHYSLSDAQSFAGRRNVVIGLGDSALEAAIALANQGGTSVDVVARSDHFRRGRRRNLDEIKRLMSEGKIRLWWSSEVRSVGLDRLVIASGAEERELAYDALFVMIGGKAATELLQQAGVRVVLETSAAELPPLR